MAAHRPVSAGGRRAAHQAAGPRRPAAPAWLPVMPVAGGAARRFARARLLAIARQALPDPVDRPRAPINALRQRPAEHAAGPDQFVGRKQPPGRIGLDDAARNQFAAHRRGVEPVSAEAARHPQAALDLADLRHAMDGATERAAPQMRDLDFSEVGKIAPDIGDQPARDPARIGLPGAHAPGPLQSFSAVLRRRRCGSDCRRGWCR